ncbi:MAG: gamma-glutamyl-gamma-aminobutyrate hydrolase family protein [Ignavibacteriales bacterium]
MPPVIGITGESVQNGKVHVRQAYVMPFAQMGCVPVIVASIACDYETLARRLAGMLDGLVLTGGGDVAPECFSEGRAAALTGVSRERDAVEIALAREFLSVDKPVLGICRGSQVLNVAAGGSLIQDIQSQVPGAHCHRLGGMAGGGLHPVEIRPGTLLEDILGRRRLDVNSRHHQSVARLAQGFVVSAESPDGVVEAIEAPARRFTAGVQWHPEDLYPRDDSVALFRRFVESCREGTRCQQ